MDPCGPFEYASLINSGLLVFYRIIFLPGDMSWGVQIFMA